MAMRQLLKDPNSEQMVECLTEKQVHQSTKSNQLTLMMKMMEQEYQLLNPRDRVQLACPVIP
ncbi:hypothetical protein CR513_00668, partial [Mucuna pruriens]